jgi:hypothetical protein
MKIIRFKKVSIHRKAIDISMDSDLPERVTPFLGAMSLIVIHVINVKIYACRYAIYNSKPNKIRLHTRGKVSTYHYVPLGIRFSHNLEHIWLVHDQSECTWCSCCSKRVVLVSYLKISIANNKDKTT